MRPTRVFLSTVRALRANTDCGRGTATFSPVAGRFGCHTVVADGAPVEEAEQEFVDGFGVLDAQSLASLVQQVNSALSRVRNTE